MKCLLHCILAVTVLPMLAQSGLSQSGTTLVHGMGYPLTYYKGFAHGRANGMLLPFYMKLMAETMPDKVEKIWEILEVSGQDDFAALLKDLILETVPLTAEELAAYVKLVMPTRAVKATAYDITPQILTEIYKGLADR